MFIADSSEALPLCCVTLQYVVLQPRQTPHLCTPWHVEVWGGYRATRFIPRSPKEIPTLFCCFLSTVRMSALNNDDLSPLPGHQGADVVVSWDFCSVWHSYEQSPRHAKEDLVLSRETDSRDADISKVA
jgi:hypothetical protein